MIKSLGGHYYEPSLGKRLPDELYRITEDPDCVHNLANELAFRVVLNELQSKMVQLLKDEQDPRVLRTFQEFDRYQ